jgi:phosphoribosylformylglycinamidine synthase
MGCGSIGGKDSMSGTFENIDVPPTLVSFAVSTADSRKVCSPEFKSANDSVIYLAPTYDENELPNFDSVKATFDKVEELIQSGRAKAVWTITSNGIAEGVFKMCLGNHIGFKFTKALSDSELFNPCYGAFLVELNGEPTADEEVIGVTTQDYTINCGNFLMSLVDLQQAWESKLEPVFPCRIKTSTEKVEAFSYNATSRPIPSVHIAKPRVVIPVFPGTNCEYDTARAFEKAGAVPEIMVINNLSSSGI